MTWKFQFEIVLNLFAAEEAQLDVAANPPCLKIELERTKRTLVQEQIAGPICRQDQNIHRIEFPGDILNQIETRSVSPVEIIEKQNKRLQF